LADFSQGNKHMILKWISAHWKSGTFAFVYLISLLVVLGILIIFAILNIYHNPTLKEFQVSIYYVIVTLLGGIAVLLQLIK
jgi:antibiotic biosynthesis monooxygenase (ABM) superfamily enzyme